MNLTTPLKRMTIFNRDMEASLALYRDILGFDVIEDKVVSGPAIAGMIGLKDCTMRICHLQAGNSEDGLIGLYNVQDPDPGLPQMEVPSTTTVAYGATSVVLSSSHGPEIYAKLKGHYQFLTEPMEYVKAEDSEYMQAGRYIEMIFRDPDGVMVSIIGYRPL